MTWSLPLLLMVGFATTIPSAFGVTYLTNRCLCNLDPFLYTVRQNLKSNNSYPSTPPPDQTTQPSNNDNENSQESPTESSYDSTTNQPANRRRKREAETSDSSSSSDGSSEKGVLTPTKEGYVDYTSKVRLIKNEPGVFYNKHYNASLCNCTVESTVALSFCLQNKKMNDSFKDSTSRVYRYHVDRLLPWIDNTFRSSYMKLLYVRTQPFGFTEFRNEMVSVHFNITLNEKRPNAIYEIKTAFSTKEVLNGRFTIKKELYETDIEYEKGCLKIRDTTPKEPEPEPSLGNLRFAFLGAALGLVLITLVIVCCGKWDKFFVRFW